MRILKGKLYDEDGLQEQLALGDTEAQEEMSFEDTLPELTEKLKRLNDSKRPTHDFLDALRVEVK